MSLDIRIGDILVTNLADVGNEISNKIERLEVWNQDNSNSPAFKSRALQDCKTTRVNSAVGGKIDGSTTDIVTGIKCFPIDPLDSKQRELLGLSGGSVLFTQTFISDSDNSQFFWLVLQEIKQ